MGWGALLAPPRSRSVRWSQRDPPPEALGSFLSFLTARSGELVPVRSVSLAMRPKKDKDAQSEGLSLGTVHGLP